MANTKSINKIISKIEKVSEKEKCLSCQCFCDTLMEFKKVLEKERNAEEIRERLTKVIQKTKIIHNCLGCDPCYPVPISNTLHEIIGSGGRLTSGIICKPTFLKPQKKPNLWPVTHGEYFVSNTKSPIAISTLGNDDLPETLTKKLDDNSFAIVGKTHTENIGLEKIIKNTISNPNIRFIILCGEDTKGHMAGQSMLALFHEGVNHEKKIHGSTGKRPVLKNLEFSEIEHFRSQVEVVDLIATDDLKAIEKNVKSCLEKNPGRFDKSIQIKTAPLIKAEEPKRLVLDPSGFFIIYPNREESKIYLEHYDADSTQNEIIYGEDPAKIISTAIEHKLVSQLDHAAYLGRELEKARLSIIYGFQYTQDSATGKKRTN
jgi:tetrahydromethanopterin S-methyltransferase subunit A